MVPFRLHLVRRQITNKRKKDRAIDHIAVLADKTTGIDHIAVLADKSTGIDHITVLADSNDMGSVVVSIVLQ